jgi:hypothetical protein
MKTCGGVDVFLISAFVGDELGQFNNSAKSSGIEPATFRLVA